MAAPTVGRLVLPAAAAVAAVFLLVFAFHGERPESGLAPFVAAGIMPLPPERVQVVEVEGGGARRRFARGPDGRWAPTPEAHARIEQALRFLHVSTPERTLTAEEVAAAPSGEFGLQPPILTVTARSASAAPFTVHFGARNPLGLARYAGIEGRRDVVLLPGFVVEAWEVVAAQP